MLWLCQNAHNSGKWTLFWNRSPTLHGCHLITGNGRDCSLDPSFRKNGFCLPKGSERTLQAVFMLSRKDLITKRGMIGVCSGKGSRPYWVKAIKSRDGWGWLVPGDSRHCWWVPKQYPWWENEKRARAGASVSHMYCTHCVSLWSGTRFQSLNRISGTAFSWLSAAGSCRLMITTPASLTSSPFPLWLDPLPSSRANETFHYFHISPRRRKILHSSEPKAYPRRLWLPLPVNFGSCNFLEWTVP